MATENTSIVAINTSAQSPKVPAYVRKIWLALKGVSASAEVKAHWAELISRQFNSLAAAQNREDGFRLKTYNDPTKHPFFLMAKHLAAGERLGCLAMGLEPNETEWMLHIVSGLLAGDWTTEELYQALQNCRNSISTSM